MKKIEKNNKRFLKCTLCKKEFVENESMGSDFMWCQECWESECDKDWY